MLKVCIWTSVPNHYQAVLFRALRRSGVDLVVCYFAHVPPDRLAMGWDANPMGGTGEMAVAPEIASLQLVPDWRNRLHVITGYAHPLLRDLARELSKAEVEWVHWSEMSRQGIRGLLSLPVKRWYAWLVNHHALGAFGIGRRAAADFDSWGMNPEKIALLPYVTEIPAIDIEPDEPCRSFRKGRFAFVYAGCLCRRKGTDILLRAFARIASRSEDWVLILVGNDRSGGKYVRQATRLGIGPRVLFRGPVPPQRIWSTMREGTVFVLPSRSDGWGVVLNEALALGLPLVATDRCGGSSELIEPGVNGFVVRGGDDVSLASALAAYVNAPGLAGAHSSQSLRVAARFTSDVAATNFVFAVNSWRAGDSRSAEYRNMRSSPVVEDLVHKRSTSVSLDGY